MNDIDLNVRFGQIDGRFNQVDGRLEKVDGRLDGIDGRLNRMDARFDGIDGRLDRMDARFDGIDGKLVEGDARFQKLEALIISEGVRTRQHLDVVAEDLKGQIKLLAEGHSALADHIVEVKGGIERLEAGQGQLDLRMRSLESRQGRLERVQKVVLTEVRGLATKVERLTPSRRSRGIPRA